MDDGSSGCYHCEVVRPGRLWSGETRTTAEDESDLDAEDLLTLEGPVERADGTLALVIPLDEGGDKFVECCRSISEVQGANLTINIPESHVAPNHSAHLVSNPLAVRRVVLMRLDAAVLIACALLMASCDRSANLPRDETPVPHGIDAGCSPELLDAIRTRDRTAVHALAQRGAKGNCEETAHLLNRGISDSDSEVIGLVIDAGADPNWGGTGDACHPPLAYAYLHMVLETRQSDDIALLLGKGADPNLPWPVGCRGVASDALDNAAGVTPLMTVVVAGDLEVVRLFIAAGANLSAQDSLGRTALDYARVGNRPETREATASLLREANRQPAAMK